MIKMMIKKMMTLESEVFGRVIIRSQDGHLGHAETVGLFFYLLSVVHTLSRTKPHCLSIQHDEPSVRARPWMDRKNDILRLDE